MKMLKILIIFTLCSTAESAMSRDFFVRKDQSGIEIRNPIRATLLGWHKYIRNIAQEFLYDIEDFGLCNFFLADFRQNISRNFFGFEVNGTINYTNGFIGTLQSVKLQDQEERYSIDEASLTSEIKSKLILNDVMLYFDYAANLTKTYFSGTVGIPIESIEFDIRILNEYKIKKIEGFILNGFAKIPYKNMRWYYEPSNTYTQIMDRDVNWNLYDDLQRLSNTSMKTLLNNVIKRHSYPEICLDCNEKMKIFEYKLKEQENY